MHNIISEELIVTIERKSDGRVFRGKGLATELNMQCDSNDYSLWGENLNHKTIGQGSWDLALRGIGALEFVEPVDALPVIVGNEWQCEWCGAVNDRQDKKCGGCLHARSFVYGA
jgi:hypothetical protein